MSILKWAFGSRILPKNDQKGKGLVFPHSTIKTISRAICVARNRRQGKYSLDSAHKLEILNLMKCNLIAENSAKLSEFSLAGIFCA
jgi:hypothetical protein